MTMSDSINGPSRRDFVKWSAFTGAALVLGVSRDERLVLAAEPLQEATFAPNQWLRIASTGAITIVAHRSEMGQGVRTALPMIVAEELGADWKSVSIVHARPGPGFENMRTSGSGSVSGAWRSLRLAAAGAREMLVGAAAAEWGVSPESCTVAQGRVTHAASGRSSGFGALVARAASLPLPAQPRLKDPSTFTLLGTRVRRVDTPAIVTGRATYGIDARVPGMRYAAISRAPSIGAMLERWSDARARVVPGVLAIHKVSNGVAIVASNTWAAFKGRDALETTWSPRAGVANDNTAAYVAALERALEHGKVARREGDVDALLRTSVRQMRATYHAPFQAHAAMEPLTCVADVRADHCELWVGTQSPNQVQTEVAKLLGISPDRVIVNVTLIGGAFGRRIAIDYAIEAVEVSRTIGAPVQVVWSREDDLRHDMYQPAQVNRITCGLDANGVPVAWRHQVADYHLSMFGAFDPNFDPASDGDPWGGFDNPYAFDAMDVTLAVLEAPVPTGAWRSVTYPAAVFARESFIDEIAHASLRDPVRLRLELLRAGAANRAGAPSPANLERLRNVLALVAERSGWTKPLARARNGRRWGRGIACNPYHRNTHVAQVAEVSVGRAGDVRVHRVVTAIDCGQVVNLAGVDAQVESGVMWALSALLKGEMTFRDGAAEQDNYSNYPVLRFSEAPVIETHVVVSRGLPPFGVGEPPVPAVGPAVANAIFAATGVRVRKTPFGAVG